MNYNEILFIFISVFSFFTISKSIIAIGYLIFVYSIHKVRGIDIYPYFSTNLIRNTNKIEIFLIFYLVYFYNLSFI